MVTQNRIPVYFSSYTASRYVVNDLNYLSLSCNTNKMLFEIQRMNSLLNWFKQHCFQSMIGTGPYCSLFLIEIYVILLSSVNYRSCATLISACISVLNCTLWVKWAFLEIGFTALINANRTNICKLRWHCNLTINSIKNVIRTKKVTILTENIFMFCKDWKHKTMDWRYRKYFQEHVTF